MKINDGERLIRSLKKKIPDSTGIYRWIWLMKEAGVDSVLRKIKERKKEPGGVAVKPGNYRLEITFLDKTATNTITVESDPRLEVSEKAINDAYNAGKELEDMIQTAAEAVKQLVESKQTVKEFQKKMKKEDKDGYKTEIKSSKEIIKKIDSLIAQYIGKDDKRQGITRNPDVTVMQRIGTANRYSRSRPMGITKTEEDLMKFAWEQFNEALIKTNSFFESEWVNYKNDIEQLNLSPFKKTKLFTIKEN